MDKAFQEVRGATHNDKTIGQLANPQSNGYHTNGQTKRHRLQSRIHIPTQQGLNMEIGHGPGTYSQEDLEQYLEPNHEYISTQDLQYQLESESDQDLHAPHHLDPTFPQEPAKHIHSPHFLDAEDHNSNESLSDNSFHSQSHMIDDNGIDISDEEEEGEESSVMEFPDAHVEYILVASFDIDRGPVMEHQYPGPISGDEHMLAELMLPDQAHVRSQDWTIFFLHKDTTSEEEVKQKFHEREDRRKGRERDPDGDQQSTSGLTDATENDEEGQDGPPLIYVLNLVNTKQDETVKRGAVVKAMAICTRHSFLHIYKPLLLLALEEYFRCPTIETLAQLYTSVNSMDLSLMPQFSHLERQILQITDYKEVYVEKFDSMIQNRILEDTRTRSRSRANSGITWQDEPKARYTSPRDTHEFESRVNYNGIPVPIRVPTAISPETVGDFSIIQLITTFSAPHTQSPQPFEIHPHLTTSGSYTHPIIVLVNALLTQKRIVFLGHNMPSGTVAEAVLAACALASGGVLRGYTRHAFPYTDLTKIEDLLKVPGFIAGVNNPAFKFKPEWWDILCDLSTGRITISKFIEQPPSTEGVHFFQGLIAQLPTHQEHGRGKGDHHGGNNHNKDLTLAHDPTGDAAFMDALQNSIVQKQGEAAVRAKWRNYITRFSRVSAAFEECVYGASALYIGAGETDSDRRGFGVLGHGVCWPDEHTKMRELAANANRIEGWRFTRSYYTFVQDLAREWRRGISVRGIDLRFQCDRLRTLSLGYDQSAAIYGALAKAIETAGIEAHDAIPTYYRTLYRRRTRRKRIRLRMRMLRGSEGSDDDADDDDDDDDDYDYDDISEVVELVSYLSTADDGEKEDSGENDDSDEDDEEGIDSKEFLEERRADARYDVINQLLIALPEHQGSLFYISMGLFHPFPEIRRIVVSLLERIGEHAAGRHYWANLDRFAKLAFYRVKIELETMPGGRPEGVGSHLLHPTIPGLTVPTLVPTAPVPGSNASARGRR